MTSPAHAKELQFSEAVTLDDGTRVSARAAHILDRLEATEVDLRKMDQTDRRWKRAGFVVLALMVLVFVYLFAKQNATAAVAAQNSGRIDSLTNEVTQLRTDGKALENQVVSLGAKPVVTVPAPQAGPAGQNGANGQNGRDGATPSDEQLLGLIRRVISENPPKDGHTPTAEELLAIIKPLIPTAVPGPQGVPGETPSDQRLLDLIKPLIPEPVPGPKGQPGETGATGATGATGPTGPQGAPGPTCPDDFTPQQHQDTDALGNPVGPAYLRCEKNP
jgi:hypothetical protein